MSLPTGFRIRLSPDVARADAGRVLVGGSPLTALRLSTRARALFDNGVLTVTDQATAQLADRLLAANIAAPDTAALNPASAEDLTVIIPVRDRPEPLARALAALRPLRVIVVDDASDRPDDTAKVASDHGAELISLTINLGPAGARNAALQRVGTPFVAFVDSDVEVTADELLNLTRHFADPAVALVGPRVTGRTRSTAPAWFERYDAAASSLSLGATPANVRPGAAVAWLPSACLVGRTAALAGGFASDLRVGEDVDLVWRLIAQGWRVRYEPDIEARHDTRTTLSAWLARKAYYGSGGADLAARHGNNVAPAVLSPAYATAAAALLLRRPWSVPLALLALARGTRQVRAALPDCAERETIARHVALKGLGWAVRQESALVLRHWWPLTAVGVLFSRNARRALVTALAIDLMVGIREHRTHRADIDPVTMIAGRRLDDLAYGVGLWYGAVRARSPRALMPRQSSTGVRPSRRSSTRLSLINDSHG